MKICDDILYNVIIIKNLISNNTYVWNKFLAYFISSPGSHKFFKPCRTFLLIDLRLLWACYSLKEKKSSDQKQRKSILQTVDRFFIEYKNIIYSH